MPTVPTEPIVKRATAEDAEDAETRIQSQGPQPEAQTRTSDPAPRMI